MRLRHLSGLMAATLLAAPMAAQAATLAVSIDGIFLAGLGSCLNAAPLGCTDPAFPPGQDSNGYYDQVTLIVASTTVDSSATSATLGQTYIFVPGDTGAGSTGFDQTFSLDRNVQVSYGTQSITQTLVQSGDLLVGDLADTLTIHASDPLSFDLSALGLTGILTLSLGETSVTAGIDPEGVVPGQIDVSPAPAPPSLALLIPGLGYLASRRHPADRKSKRQETP